MGKHSHNHEESDANRMSSGLGFALAITCAILIFQLVGSYLSNSLALLGDTGHVFSDLISLSLSFFACRLAMSPSCEKRTFGYHRAEVFAALANSLLLLVMALVVAYEAFMRVAHPVQINSPVMLAFALVGLLGNAWVVLMLAGQKNLNVKSAMLHALSDALSSIGVIISAVVIALTGITVFDSIASFFIAGLMLLGSYRVGVSAIRILFEFSPRGMDANEICGLLGGVPGIEEVHDVHIWSVCSDLVYVTAHVVVADIKISKSEKIAEKLSERLKKLGVSHSTFQFETKNPGHEKETACNVGR